MKVLLIFPPIENKLNFYGGLQFEPINYSLFPPLGILYLATFLKQNLPEVEVKVVDCPAQKIGYADLEKVVREFKPEIVGLTVYTYCLVDALKVAKTVKSVSRDIHVCMGGYHLEEYPRETLEIPEVDSIIRGEGEEAFSALVALRMGRSAEKPSGLYFKSDLREKNNFTLSMIRDIDALPVYDTAFIDKKFYYSSAGNFNDVIPIVSSRGCPYHCTFCSSPYKDYRSRSMEGIIEEIRQRQKEGYREVFFFDDTFNISSQRVLEFARNLQASGIRIRWSFRARADAVTWEMLREVKKSGCERIRFGVETGTDEGLKNIRKGISVAQIERALGWCRKLGIITIADYLIGFPFETTKEEVRKSIHRLVGFAPDYAQFNVLQIMPGSDIFRQAMQKGVLDVKAWNDFIRSPYPEYKPPVWEEFLSRKDLEELRVYAYKKFYFRPLYFLKTIFSLRSFREIRSVWDAGRRIILGH